MIATTMVKAVLVALWSTVVVVVLPLSMVMVDLVMLAMNVCSITWNQTMRVPSKK
jgi:hypothetical protein